MNNGKVFLQELFEEGPISNIIPQHPRSGIRTMMKQKGKAFVEEQVFVKRKLMSKGKESQKMFQWMRIGSNELKWAK
jgi:hypothetical protein